MKTVSMVMKKTSQSQDSQRTLYYPDLYVLTDDEYWTMTPETHKYAAAAGSFCFSMTGKGDQQDICNLITMPCVQRSLYFNEGTNNFGNMKVEVPKGVDGRTRDVLERFKATYGRAAGARSKMRSVHGRKHQLQKNEDTTNSLLKQSILSTDHGLTTKFFISST